MLFVLVTGLLITLAVLGWGALGAALLGRAAGFDLRGAVALGEYGLLGLAVLAPISLLLNFFVALDAPIGAATVAVGLAGAGICRARLRRAFGFGLPAGATALLVAGLAIALWGEAVRQPLAYDSGLYHLQTILMDEDSRVVLGAANIHSRFGYNSAWLVLCAVFSLPGYRLAGAMTLNGMVALLALLGMIERAVHSVATRGLMPSGAFAIGTILVAAFAKLLPRMVVGPSTDLPPALLTLYALLLALAAIEPPQGEATAADRCGVMLLAFAVSALAVVCKTSQAPVALAVLPAALTVVHQLQGRRAVAAGAGAAALLGLAWIVHGVALSGCMLYPVSASCIPHLPWTVPLAVIANDMAGIVSWARVPGGGHGLALNGWRWVAPWLANISGERLVRCLKVVVALSLVMLALRLVARDRFRCLWETLDRRARRAASGIVAVAAIGVVYWFLTAPALRFGLGFVIALPVLLLSFVVPATSRLTPPGVRRIAWAVGALGVMLAVVALSQQTTATLLATDLPAIPQAALDERHTAAGDSYFLPRTGDQCWAAPRFCTPRASPGLAFEQLGMWRMAVAPH